MANKSNAPRLGEKTLGQKVKDFIGNNSVPIMFILICLYCIPMSGFSASYLLNEVMTRLGRNAFLILSLLIPIMAGMGLNFGMTLGAMAGEIGLIFVADWQIWGIPGLVLAAIISIPISIGLGVFIGKILNKAKGREMITSYMIAFFMTGIYQLVVLYMMGPIIPIKHASIKLPRGYGIRNTVSLLNMRQRRGEDPCADADPHRSGLPVHCLVPQNQAGPGYAGSWPGYGGGPGRRHQRGADPCHRYGHVHRLCRLRHDHLPAKRRQLPHLHCPLPDRYVRHCGAAGRRRQR